MLENDDLKQRLASSEEQRRQETFKNQQLKTAVERLESDRERADLAIRQLEGIVERLKVADIDSGSGEHLAEPVEMSTKDRRNS